MSAAEKKINIEVLKKILQSPDSARKLKALALIERETATNAVPVLCIWLSHETDRQVLLQMLYTIGELGEEKHASQLEAMIQNPDNDISEAAKAARDKIFTNMAMLSKVRELKSILGKSRKKIEKRWEAVKLPDEDIFSEDSIVTPANDIDWPTDQIFPEQPDTSPVIRLTPEAPPAHPESSESPDTSPIIRLTPEAPASDRDTPMPDTPSTIPERRMEGSISVNIEDQQFITTRRKLGEILVDEGFISEEQFVDILKEQEDNPHTMIGQLLLKNNLITERDLMKCLAMQKQIPYISLKDFVPDPALVERCGFHWIQRYLFVPIEIQNQSMIIAVADPTFRKGIEEVELALHMKISIVVADKTEIMEVISKL